MTAYYNEIDAYAAQWLRNLIAAGHIAPGDVDERSIEDVNPDDLRGYRQCHFFAGIGIWSHALRRAGWADDREVWTGSCPCQPFSAAGQGGGFDDERHLWPAFLHLIAERRPGVVIGEQVASKDGLAWLDLVQADLEGEGYPVGAVDTCSAGFGAPHIRQRLYWMGVTDRAGPQPRQQRRTANGHGHPAQPAGTTRLVAGVGHEGFQIGSIADDGRRAVRQQGPSAATHVVFGELADTDQQVQGGRGVQRPRQGDGAGARPACERFAGLRADGDPGPANGFWRAADWLFCRDGKWRPVEEGTFPLAHGDTSRVGGLRAFGNAINAEQATEFCIAVRAELAQRLRLMRTEGGVFA